MKKSLLIIFCVLTCAFLVNGQSANPPLRFPVTQVPASPRSPLRPAAPIGYWDPNRKLNPNGPAHGNPRLTTEQDFKFKLKDSASLRDALGKPLGTIAPGTHFKINKSAGRMIIGPDKKLHMYEFVLGAKLKKGPGDSEPSYGSGFVRRSAIPVPQRPALDHPKSPKVKGPTTAYSITGGNPTSAKLGQFDSQKQFVPYKFKDRKTGKGYTTPHRESTDYLARPVGSNSYVNVLSKLPGKGGTAAVVYKVDKKNPVIFHRLTNVPAKTVKLYKKGGDESGSMKFLKGYVTDPKTHEKTVGWVAQDALKAKPKASKATEHKPKSSAEKKKSKK
ncbi:MAG TPA: hypothetical protein VGO68_13825 [Pyrinomonadaceae bacterium]|jgi:hypothetical protein|nr:hypothetical protein [Pyrinomonadaceae bacterium]